MVDEFRARRREAFCDALGGLSEPQREQVFSALELVVGALDTKGRSATVGLPEVSKQTGKSVRV